jgi:hypothetical protein
MALDLKLNDDHDLDVTNYDLSTIDTLEYVAQKLRIKLKFFIAEWFLDTTKGMELFQIVFVKNPDFDLIASIFRNEIMSVPEVKSITEYAQEFDSKNRELTITFKVDTIYGTLTDSIEVEA